VLELIMGIAGMEARKKKGPTLPKWMAVKNRHKALKTGNDFKPDILPAMKAKSVRKKMQQKSFAANVSREDIVHGAQDLGVELDEHIQFVIDAMAGIADQLGLSGGQTTK